MIHIPLNVTEEQRGNLLYLAEYLDTDVTEWPFGMNTFQLIDESGCGTSACAVGHGPLIGIMPLKTEYLRDGDVRWGPYSQRAFVGDQAGYAWAFLFAASWHLWDNTARGAAARIYYALEHGIPHKEPSDPGYDPDDEDYDFGWWATCYTVNPQPRYTIEDLMPRVRARLEESA